ncbi:hypothetical protein ILUMI_20108 [Ignelater luminosus]|uniref:Uncharacterized protein n=1 Tax=Ignelater luminosus TaxID=2038154 RepID=A0A8K0FZ85_IGNLU|nr:hypothetical protein ILUMI_20108 [Ignelater luminosus]
MIERADIKESMLKTLQGKKIDMSRFGSRNQASFCPFVLREVSVLPELTKRQLRYSLTNVPLQPGSVLYSNREGQYVGVRQSDAGHVGPRDAARPQTRVSRAITRLARAHRDDRRTKRMGAAFRVTE